MKVFISADILNDPHQWDQLDRITFFFLDGRHIWELTDPAHLEASGWLADEGRAGRRNREVYEKCLTLSAYPVRQSPALHITIASPSDGSLNLTPVQAIQCLDAPAYVFVENAESDGAFLRFILKASGRADLLSARDVGWLRFEHLGGFGEIEKRLDDVLQHTVGPQRVFVVSDSDRLYPGHETGTMAKIKSACEARNVPYAILRKRSSENYLTAGALNRSTRKKCYAAYLNLNQLQRDHYDMKDGFAASSERDNRGRIARVRVSPQQAQLYRYVASPVLRDLCHGFGNNAWTLFLGHEATDPEIRAENPPNGEEFDSIIHGIENIL